MLPGAVRAGVERALQALGLPGRIESATPVRGGCINRGLRLRTDAGTSYFLKWNEAAPPEMFLREAEGLLALAAYGPLRVPEPLEVTEPDASPTWLLMEWIEPGAPLPGSQERLGEGLAALHAHAAPERFGWEKDNWIGSLHQPNDPEPSWGVFWRDRRLAPQLAAARRSGMARAPVYDRLLDRLPTGLEDVEAPELVHGDLWSGNVFFDERGEPVLIDPAVYAGHGEVDLAMSELFGGFGPGFYDAYDAARGISEAYRSYRRALYQLYYLLVHVNLFGASYAASARDAADRVVAELG